MKSEYDANQWLMAPPLRVEDDPLEQTQRMPVADRRRRQAEARAQQHVDATVDAAAARLGWQAA